MAVRLSALRAGRPLPPGKFLILISLRGLVDHRAIVLLEGLGQLKNPMTSLGIESATFRIKVGWANVFVWQSKLDVLRYLVGIHCITHRLYSAP
jgi:hypothetical protein